MWTARPFRPWLLTVLAVAFMVRPIDSSGAGNTAPLIEAARQGDIGSIRTLLQRHADVNATSVDGTTALHWAAQRGALDALTLLLLRGAHVDVANRYGV